MLRWIPFVMVRIVGFFSAGILLGVYKPHILPVQASSFFLILLFIVYLLLFFILKKRKFLSGLLGLIALFVAGYVHVIYFTNSNDEEHLLHNSEDVKYYTGVISSAGEEKENSLKYELELLKINNGKEWISKNAKIVIYVSKKSNLQELFYGDEIMVDGSPSELDPPSNPYEFNYKRFLGFNNIYHQHFIATADHVRLVEKESLKNFYYYSFKARTWASNKIITYIPGAKEQAIALALTLGVKEGIDNDLQKAYASSGAMHVLAVSGLHVGIIYGIILLVFKPFGSRSWTRWVVALVSVLLLWAYAFITGMSPSVLRAVTMFSFIAVAKPFGRSTNIYNTMAGSAFLLLIFNPYLIMSVGFQLSYLAVLGIVTIHRPLYMMLEPKYLIVDWIWNISCVSIAAQLATFSLGILYFHQFPVYFLFSNLFVIPGAVLILVGSVSLILLSFINPLAIFLGKAIQLLIQVLNGLVYMVEDLPFSLIEGIYLTTFQCWLLIALLVFFIFFLRFRNFQYLLVSSVLVFVFSMSQWFHFYADVNDERLIVYSVSDHTAIEWIKDGTSFFYSDEELVNDEERMRFHIVPSRLHCGVNKVNFMPIEKGSLNSGVQILKFHDKIIAIVKKPIFSWPDDLNVDYLVVANNSFKSYSEASDLINFDKIILDSSNSRWISSQIEEATDPDLVYNVRSKGAFVYKF